jgi:hypothetical protein
MNPEVSGHLLSFGARRIAYRLHRAARRRLKIVVSPDLRVDVFAPPGVDLDAIRAAVTQKAPWIAAKLDKMSSLHPLPVPQGYISGETLVYLGRQYRLKVVPGSRKPPKLIGKFLWVWTEDDNGGSNVKKKVDGWYRRRAVETLSRYVDRCHRIAARHGVPAPRLAIRAMRKRWGSCSARGRITLNVKLVQAPIHCIEYVIMHELCHLKHHDHSKAFYSLLTRCLPYWRVRKQMLERTAV